MSKLAQRITDLEQGQQARKREFFVVWPGEETPGQIETRLTEFRQTHPGVEPVVFAVVYDDPPARGEVVG